MWRRHWPYLIIRNGFVCDQRLRRMHAMLSGLLLWLGATACLFNHTSANFEKTCTTEDYYQQPRGLCGPKLSNILGIVCHNGYNKRANGKYGGKCRKTTVNNERFY